VWYVFPVLFFLPFSQHPHLGRYPRVLAVLLIVRFIVLFRGRRHFRAKNLDDVIARNGGRRRRRRASGGAAADEDARERTRKDDSARGRARKDAERTEPFASERGRRLGAL